MAEVENLYFKCHQGGLLLQQGKVTEATKVLQSALQKQPQFSKARYQLVLAYLQAKDFCNADLHLQSLLKNDPCKLSYLELLLDCLLAQQKITEAVQLVEKLQALVNVQQSALPLI